MNPAHRRVIFRFRAFVSLLTACSFLIMAVTGIILYLAPSTRLADLGHWRIWTFTRARWVALHLSFSAVFLLCALIHLWLNRKPLWTYLKIKSKTLRGLRWEWLAVLLLAAAVVWATLIPVEPVTSLLALRQKYYKGAPPTPENTPPQSDRMGQLTLAEYCRRLDLDVDRVLERLRQDGIEAAKTDTLRSIADQNGLHPSAVRRLIESSRP